MPGSVYENIPSAHSCGSDYGCFSSSPGRGKFRETRGLAYRVLITPELADLVLRVSNEGIQDLRESCQQSICEMGQPRL